ncbi:hypothetical protein A6M21_01720 [Desulfotomaculum copahuensis]|uniref:Uncharacterized protein n=1 Tax=Desulfotomaculum copahuensis TaxID=1838280 RepID=A0A1B7LKK9_9FIRM|nr:hypothetical protein A6M21_01720 [Desulfotomaculum copahuensis]
MHAGHRGRRVFPVRCGPRRFVRGKPGTAFAAWSKTYFIFALRLQNSCPLPLDMIVRHGGTKHGLFWPAGIF